MKILNQIMALTMTTLLTAAPAFAADYTLGDAKPSASISSDTKEGVGQTKVNSSIKTDVSGNRVSVKQNMGLHRCGGNRGRGMGNKCNLTFTSLDRNGNGVITRKEFRKDRLSIGLFKKIDKNHNGVISQSELDAYNK